MADPNFANVAEQLAFVIDRYDEVEKVTSPSPGYVTRDIAALADVDGYFAQGVRNVIQNDRNRIAGLLAQDNVLTALSLGIRQMALAIESGQTAQDLVWQDLYDYMITNAQSVNSRAFTYGTPSGSGTGNGICVRLTKDEQGLDLEGWWPDAYTVKCDADARQTGQLHDESFTVSGTDAAPDELARTGSGLVKADSARIKASNGRDSNNLVKNPSWNSFTSTAAVGSPAAPTALPSWSGYTALSNFQIDYDITYRTTPGEATSTSVRFTTNEVLSQNLTTVGLAKFDPDTPYYFGVAVYRRDSCDGTLTIALGGVSRAVTMTTLSNNAWTWVPLVATAGANNWFKNFNANSLTLSFTLASRTTGSLHLDDITAVPFTRLGAGKDGRRGRGSMGTYMVVVGGTTPFLRGYTFTFTDSVGGTRGVNQYWFCVANRGYLPHNNAAAETWADK